MIETSLMEVCMKMEIVTGNNNFRKTEMHKFMNHRGYITPDYAIVSRVFEEGC